MTTQRVRLALFVLSILLAAASAAEAQVLGGGGGGYGGQVVQWFVQNILAPLIDVVIIGAGIIIATRTGHIFACAAAVAGLEVAVHYSEIHGLIG